MRILFLTGREISYPRNDTLLRAFRHLAHVDVAGGEKGGSIITRSIYAMLRATILLRNNQYELCVVGFYGHLIMLYLAMRRHPPIIFDPFISTFDTLVTDRHVVSSRSPIGRLAKWLDLKACQAARVLLYDTAAHRRYFQEAYDLHDRQNSVIPVSCSEELFYPHENIRPQDQVLLFYSTFMPLHGIDVILNAVALLPEGMQIQVKLIGDGGGKKAAMQLARDLNLTNIEFLPSTEIEALPGFIADATVCLGGPFGRSEKADRVIPGKVYQLMAMGKPIIAADTSANRELLIHRKSAYLCERNNPSDLARSIQEVFTQPELRESLSHGARESYLRHASERVVLEKIMSILGNLLK